MKFKSIVFFLISMYAGRSYVLLYTKDTPVQKHLLTDEEKTTVVEGAGHTQVPQKTTLLFLFAATAQWNNWNHGRKIGDVALF